jgi:hypothetical protein
MRKINDLVLGKPSNRAGLWAMTNKQASGSGHTLSAFACFNKAHQKLQCLLGYDFLINKHPGKCKHLSAHYTFIKLELDLAPCIGVSASEDDSAH